MKVQVWLSETSQPIVFDAESTYQKGDMFCVKYAGITKTKKFPLDHIFCVIEEEFVHSHDE